MVLGIDLGTSNTVVSSLSTDGSPVLIPDAFNKSAQSTPSVALIEDNRAYAGEFAENLFEFLPDKQIISYFKRSFGTPEPVFFDSNKTPWFSETVASLILKKIKFDASMYLPDGYRQTVITVPAHYNDIQRKSVIEAARLAELELTAIIEEPIAAALYYSSFTKKIDDEIILVYDFGGGTFDLTLVTKSGNQMNVIAKDGVNRLGGKEFDGIVMNTIIAHYEKSFDAPFPTDKLTANRLKKIAEGIKIELNDAPASKNLSKWIIVGREGLEVNFLYDEYAQKALRLITDTEVAVNRCLHSLGMKFTDINKIILTGGTSSSKMVYNFWKSKIGSRQELIYHQPLSSVAKGAALYAASLGQGSQSSPVVAINLKGVSTYNIGVRIENHPGFVADPGNRIDLLVHRNTPLPVSAKKIYRVIPQQSEYFCFSLYQFWNMNEDLHLLGTAKAGPFPMQDEFNVEVWVENRADGTIGLKLRNADNGRDLKFEFTRKQSVHKYDFRQQKNMVDGIYLNNYL
jgi:molecular chaperone DnaK (HSP70)